MKELVLFREYREPKMQGSVYCGDAFDFLKNIQTETAGIILLDPPFNLGKKYLADNNELDNLPESEYSIWIKGILDECIRALCEGGALYLYHLPKWAMRFGNYLERHLQLRHWIAISMKNGFVRPKRLYPAHYALLYFTKGSPRVFNRPKLEPQKCRKCGTTIKDYGGYRSIIEKQGINLSDFWEDISPVRHANRKLRAANQLPITMTDRIIEISGQADMLYADPFAGTGTGVLSAAKHGMRFMACDIVDSNCSLIESRLLELTKTREETNINV